MASILENEYYLHGVPLETSETPEIPPRNTTQLTKFGLRRGHLTSPRNIWQTTPNFTGNGFGHDRRAIFPGASGRVAKPPEPALTQSYDTIATVNEERHESRPTTRSSRVISRPSQPPHQSRTHGALRANGSRTTTSMGNMSLLSGSAPDIDPSNYPASDFNDHHDQSDGKNLRNFDFEGIEDFVPSYLRDQSEVHSQRNGHGTSQPSPSHRNHSQWNPDGIGGTYDLRTTQEQESPTHESFRANSSRNVLEANTRALGAPGREVFIAGTYQSDIISSSAAISSPSHGWSFSSTADNTNVNDHRFPRRTGSNLRPEVAVYQPLTYKANHANGVSDLSEVYRTRYAEDSLPSRAGDGYIQPPHHPLSAVNSNTFISNAPPGSMQNSMFWSRPSQQLSMASSAVPAQGFERAVIHSERPLDESKHARMTQYQSKCLDEQQRPLRAPECLNQPYFPSGHYENVHGDPQMTTYHNLQSSGPIPDLCQFAPASSGDETAVGYQPEKSSLLQEFAATHKQKKWDIKDIKHHVVEFCGDSNGSRWIQEKMDHASVEEKEQLWSEVLTNVRQLMNDTYGNYVIQKLFDHGTQSQKRMLGNHMKGYMFFLSMQTYGCRVVQKAFEHILTDQQASLVRELEGHVIKVVESQHGNHVIQKAIETIPAEHIQFIVDAHKHQVVRLARHTYGCRVIQRILEHCTPQAKRPILDELHCAIPVLIDDPFGNYVIQNIITKGSPNDRHRVVGFVQQRLLYYSTHKFASNVVEKAIEHADDSQRVEMLRQLTSSDPNNFMPTPVLDLIKDQYGNYVMQTVLKRIQGPAKRRLVDEIRHHLYMLGNTGHSKQVIAMSKTLNDVTAGHSPSSASTSPQTPQTPTSSKSGGINTISNKNPLEIVLSAQGLVLPVRSGRV